MSDINIGVSLKGLPTPEMLNPSDKQEGVGAGPKLAGIFSGPNLSVMQGGGSADLNKLMETLKMESDESRAKQALAFFKAAIASIAAQDAAAAAKVLLLEAKTQAIENLIESMKPTKEELETARRRKQTIADSIKTKEDRQKDLKGELATKQALISTLDATKDAAQIAQLSQECEDLKSEISSLGVEVKQLKGEDTALDKKINDLVKELEGVQQEVDKLVNEVEAGIRSLANAVKHAGGAEDLSKAEARRGVQESVDPVKEKEEREEKLKELGILTDIFQVWAQSIQGVKEADIEIGPHLRDLMDEIDTNKNNLV